MNESQLSSTETEKSAESPVPAHHGLEGAANGGAPAMNPDCVREFHIEVDANVVDQQWSAVEQRYAKMARIPGFRRGKVPAGLVRRRFAGEIRNDVLEALVPKHFREIMAANGLRAASSPLVNNLQMEPGQPLRFTVKFEVLPDIQLADYRDIQEEVPAAVVTDEDIENDLKVLQEKKATMEPVEEDRPLQDGDFAQISFEGVRQDVPQTDAPDQSATAEQTATTQEEATSPEKSGEPVAEAQPAAPSPRQPEVISHESLVEIGGENTKIEFADNLRGARIGEERQFEVTYPKDHYESALAGKTFNCRAKVNGIKKKRLPEIDDDLAREYAADTKYLEINTLEDLRRHLREMIELFRKDRLEKTAQNKFIDALLARHDFPVPETMVQGQVDAQVERGLRQLVQHGFPAKRLQDLQLPDLRRAQRPTAVQHVKLSLLLAKIAEAENIEVTEEQLNHELELAAVRAGETPEALRERLNHEDHLLEAFRSQIRSAITLDRIYRKPASSPAGAAPEPQRGEGV